MGLTIQGEVGYRNRTTVQDFLRSSGTGFFNSTFKDRRTGHTYMPIEKKDEKGFYFFNLVSNREQLFSDNDLQYLELEEPEEPEDDQTC